MNTLYHCCDLLLRTYVVQNQVSYTNRPCFMYVHSVVKTQPSLAYQSEKQ